MLDSYPSSNPAAHPRFAALVSLLLVGCGAETEASQTETVKTERVDAGPAEEEPAEEEPAETEPADAGARTDECSDLYDSDRLPTFNLEFTSQELAGLEQDCANNTQQYRPITFEYGDERVEAMVRLKGNWSWRCDKMQFVISFNETDSKGRFHGLRKLVLDAAWYDPTLLGERLGASYMQRLGVPASCVNNAKLYINGDYYGVYSNVERLDKEYLERHFAGSDADGNLYNADGELRTNEDVGDVSRREALFANATSLSTIETMVDLHETLKVWAGLAILPDVDSYWAGVEINYFLYDHPGRGFMWLPYDMDMTAPTGAFNPETSSVDFQVLEGFVQADPIAYENGDWGKEVLFKTVLSSDTWCQQFVEYLKDALAAYDVERMRRDLQQWSQQIAGAVEGDPNKPFTAADHKKATETMLEFLGARREFIEQWLAKEQCPVQTW